jgi:hypothetical protein
MAARAACGARRAAAARSGAVARIQGLRGQSLIALGATSVVKAGAAPPPWRNTVRPIAGSPEHTNASNALITASRTRSSALVQHPAGAVA